MVTRYKTPRREAGAKGGVPPLLVLEPDQFQGYLHQLRNTFAMASGDATAWKRRMGQQNVRRKDTDDLWRRLDDLIADASEFPHTLRTEPCALSTIRPCPPPIANWPL